MKYFKTILLKNRLLIAGYLLLGIFLAFLDTFSASYFQKVIDAFGTHTLTPASIAFYAGLLIMLYLLSYLDEYPSAKLNKEIYYGFRELAFWKISTIDYRSYQLLGTGNLIQKIENGARTGADILYEFYFCCIRELLPNIVFSLIFITRINPGITKLILFGYLFVFLITNLLLRFLYKIKETILNNEEAFNRRLVRGFMEMVVFRTNKRFGTEIKKAEDARKSIVSSNVKMKLIHEAFFAAFAILIAIVKVIILVIGWKTGSLTVGAVVALLTLVDRAYQPIAVLNVLYTQYKLDKTAFARYTDFLSLPDDSMLNEGDEIRTLSGDTQIRDLCFAYRPSEPPLLDHISLSIPAGTVTALVGESGSGKSTLIKLLTGLLKPDSGEILLDQKRLSEIRLDSYYDHISYTAQESPVFDGTLRENLVFDSSVPDEELIHALRCACLTTFFEKLPEGLDTPIGEKGILLSGGEKQRLALARLWFTKAGLILLDEATSALDNITEELVMEQLLKQLSGRTVVLIAHRLKSIKNADRIVVFRNGRIVGNGRFEALFRENVYFRELYLSDGTQSDTTCGDERRTDFPQSKSEGAES